MTAIRNAIAVPFRALMQLIEIALGWVQSRIGTQNMGYFFVLPNLIIFGVFVLFPMLLNFSYATSGGTELFPANRPFTGIENFQTLTDCESIFEPNSCSSFANRFWKPVWNTFVFVFFNVMGMVLVSLFTALALNSKIRARAFFRSVFFYPVLLSPVVVALIWRWVLQRNGVLNSILVALGGEPIAFLNEADWAMFWVIFVSIWATMGFYTLILLAGLQSIPADLYEASAMDGATPISNLRFITLPLLMPTMFVVLVLSLIRAVQAFDLIFVLTGGGPGTATKFIVQFIYETAFSGSTRIYGIAAAASVFLGVGLLIFTMIQLRLGRDSGSV